jgi:hypothetical protein
MKITAAIVTYNRFALLKECVEAVKAQSYPLSSVVVIDNASTDGTREYLDLLEDERFYVQHCKQNMGGAWGFAEGIALATRQGADAVWIMDDDTVPKHDALEKLVEVLESRKQVGFVNSKVVWVDGSIHQMNIPGYVAPDTFDGEHPVLRSASFVSLLVPCKVIREVGLPYRDFFIWVDDAEFTSRIFKAGYNGLLVNNSIVVHKTAANYGANLKYATPESAWKFYYYMRNGMFASRGERPWIVWFFRHLNHLRLDIRRTKLLPKEVRKDFKYNLWRGFVDGLTFHPQLERV